MTIRRSGPRYLTVRKVARALGVGERSVYNYIAKGQLPAAHVEECLLVNEDDVFAFKRTAPGRTRLDSPHWHVPPLANLPYLTTITVRIRQGQETLLEQRLHEFRIHQRHCLKGTAARYILRDQHHPEQIEILLLWRSASLPKPDQYARALADFYSDLEDVLDWQTAIQKEGLVLLLT